MMWIFEWDIVTGDSAALDSIYAVSRDDLDAADRRRRAGGRGRRGRCATQVAATDPGDLALPRALPVVRRRARLRDGPAAARSPRTGRWSCGTRSGSTPAARPRTTSGGRPSSEYRARARRARRRGTPATSTCPRTTSPPPTSAATAPTATPRWPGSPAVLLARGRCVVLRARAARRGAFPARRRCARCSSRRPGRGGSASVAGPDDARRPGARLGAARGRPGGEPAASTPGSPRPRTSSRRSAPGCVLAVVLRCVVGGRDPFHLWAALGGVVLLRTRDPARRARGPRARALLVRLLDRPDLAHGLHHRRVRGVLLAVRRRRPGAAARLRAAAPPGRSARPSRPAGLALAVVAGGVAAIGLERALTIWNDQMALLPWGLSRILGITVYLGIPPSSAGVLAVVGLVVAAVGVALALLAAPPDLSDDGAPLVGSARSDTADGGALRAQRRGLPAGRGRGRGHRGVPTARVAGAAGPRRRRDRRLVRAGGPALRDRAGDPARLRAPAAALLRGAVELLPRLPDVAELDHPARRRARAGQRASSSRWCSGGSEPAVPFLAALVLGAVVAPPDAVAAAAVGKRLGCPAAS